MSSHGQGLHGIGRHRARILYGHRWVDGIEGDVTALAPAVRRSILSLARPAGGKPPGSPSNMNMKPLARRDARPPPQFAPVLPRAADSFRPSR